MSQVVGQIPTVTSLTSSANPSLAGHAITLTASVSPASATGTVTFSDGGLPLGNAVALSGGSASFVTSSLVPGTHALTASYSGDTDDLPSVSTLIGAPTTFFSAAPGTLPDSSGQGVGFSTRLSGTGTTYTGDDPNLTLNTTTGTLTLMSQPSDLNGQSNLPAAEDTFGLPRFPAPALAPQTISRSAPHS